MPRDDHEERVKRFLSSNTFTVLNPGKKRVILSVHEVSSYPSQPHDNCKLTFNANTRRKHERRTFEKGHTAI